MPELGLLVEYLHLQLGSSVQTHMDSQLQEHVVMYGRSVLLKDTTSYPGREMSPGRLNLENETTNCANWPNFQRLDQREIKHGMNGEWRY